ncbi:hypothetical protein VU06_02695 [Desulfobulbus sp. F3]|nr:hypothetical protein [Desulfobulbus sp. F3]
MEKFSWNPAGCGLLPEAERMTCVLLKEEQSSLPVLMPEKETMPELPPCDLTF